MAFKLRFTWILVALLCGLAALAVSDSGAVGAPSTPTLTPDNSQSR
jgi:hypothetical protein